MTYEPDYDDLDDDERPEPDDLYDIATEHGVPLAALRQALRESHPDASLFEVIGRAAEIAKAADDAQARATTLAIWP